MSTSFNRVLSPIEAALRAALIRAAIDRNLTVFDYTSLVINGGLSYEICVGEHLPFELRRLGSSCLFGSFIGQGAEVSRPRGDERDGTFAVFPQTKIGQYRCDFALEMASGSPDRWLSNTFLAVECDGHEWHERTKQQAAYDRARDRDLLRFGVPTVRFTGSEIVRDPDQCAYELIDTLVAVRDARNHIADRAVEIFAEELKDEESYREELRRAAARRQADSDGSDE